ncbi:MAG TPA: transposase [Methylomirabilota bacterium]|nr:transposase [Methylomirabilota bacterium]
MSSRGPRQAQQDGFDLHANVWVPARDRARLERLCRYLLRPPLAQERLRRRADGRVVVGLRKVWRDGTTRLLLEPAELLEKLAGLTPRPEAHLLLYHGVLAPHAGWRRQVVGFGRPLRPPEEGPAGRSGATARPRESRDWAWAALMRHAFGLDVLACPRCGGRLRFIATLHDPAVVAKILAHLDRPHSAEPHGPDPPPADIGAAAPASRQLPLLLRARPVPARAHVGCPLLAGARSQPMPRRLAPPVTPRASSDALGRWSYAPAHAR